MKAARRDILRLIQTYIEKGDNDKEFMEVGIPTLKTLVDDYQAGAPEARDPEILCLFSTMVKHMSASMQNFLDQILFGLCQSTLEVV